MNQLYKQSNNHFQPNTQASKLSSFSQLNDPNRQKPNLIRINADNQDKKFMCIFWSIILIFIITLAIVSKTLPSSIQSITNQSQLSGTSLQNCQNPSVFQNDILKCTNFTKQSLTVGMITKQLSSLNQFVSYYLNIYPKNLTTSITIDQNITYLVYGLQKPSNYYKKGQLFQNQTQIFQYTSQSTSYIYDDNNKIKGYKLFVGFIGQFSTDNLLLVLQFSGPYEQFSNVNTIQMQAYKISKTFTAFTIALRYIFFVLSILAAFLYIRKYRKISETDRIIQQKLIAILSIFLIFFNDPFYPITVLKQNMASSFFSMLFVLSFIVYLIFLWVIFFDRIYYQQGKKDTQQITKVKIAYAIVLFILLMTLYMLYANYRLNNHPLVPKQRLTDRTIIILDIVVSICFGVIGAYLILQYVRICCYKTDRLWRSQLFMSYSLLFMTAMAIFIFTDNALGSYSYDGTTIIFLYGLMNLYTWYLQYMYSPTKLSDGNQKRSINSDQIMSIGTVQFNDLNINLDQHQGYKKYQNEKQNYNKSTNNKLEINNQHIKWSNTNNNNHYQDQNDRKYSIQDQEEHKHKDDFQKYIQNKNHKQQNNHKQQMNNRQQNIDFFNQQNIHKYSNQQTFPHSQTTQSKPHNQTNLLHLSTNQVTTSQQPQILHPQHSQLLSNNDNDITQVDQNKLTIISQTQSQNNYNDGYDNLQSQQHIQEEVKQQKKQQKDNGFGDFQLE